eukprot:2903881-Pyramimonas_sp.AAC.1
MSARRLTSARRCRLLRATTTFPNSDRAPPLAPRASNIYPNTEPGNSSMWQRGCTPLQAARKGGYVAAAVQAALVKVLTQSSACQGARVPLLYRHQFLPNRENIRCVRRLTTKTCPSK